MELINKITIFLSIVLFAHLNINSAVKIDFNDPVYEQDKKLLEAARTNNISEIKKLIKQKVNLNSQDVLDKETALMTAASLGHLEITELLINNGADLNLKNADGDTALMHIAKQFSCHIETTKLLIDAGADLNETDNYGNTALTMALERQHGEIAMLLIQSGANVNIVNNNNGHSLELIPFNFYKEKKSLGVEIAKAMLISDKNINHVGAYKDALEVSASFCNYELVQLLLYAGANYKHLQNGFIANGNDMTAKEQIAKLFEDEEKRRAVIINKWMANAKNSILNNSNLAMI